MITYAPLSVSPSIPVAISTNGRNVLIAGIAGKRIVVTGMVLISGGAVNLKFQSDTGSVQTDLTGALPLAANTGFAPGEAANGHFSTASGEGLTINLSAGVAVGGWLNYSIVNG